MGQHAELFKSILFLCAAVALFGLNGVLGAKGIIKPKLGFVIAALGGVCFFIGLRAMSEYFMRHMK